MIGKGHYSKSEKSVYRHRGFNCSVCKYETQVFGSDPVPTDCPNCSSTGTLGQALWDHEVTITVAVKDWVTQ